MNIFACRFLENMLPMRSRFPCYRRAGRRGCPVDRYVCSTSCTCLLAIFRSLCRGSHSVCLIRRTRIRFTSSRSPCNYAITHSLCLSYDDIKQCELPILQNYIHTKARLGTLWIVQCPAYVQLSWMCEIAIFRQVHANWDTVPSAQPLQRMPSYLQCVDNCYECQLARSWNCTSHSIVCKQSFGSSVSVLRILT